MYDTRNFEFVDNLVADLDRIADRMEAVGFGKAYQAGHVTVLREIAADARREVREEEHIPTAVRFDRLSASSKFGLWAAAAPNSRTDLPANIVRLFAAAKVQVPAKDQRLSSSMINMVLDASKLEIVERIQLKRQMDALGLVDFSKP